MKEEKVEKIREISKKVKEELKDAGIEELDLEQMDEVAGGVQDEAALNIICGWGCVEQ